MAPSQSDVFVLAVGVILAAVYLFRDQVFSSEHAEEYAIHIAKEAKAKFGLASLVCDPEEYGFENLDQLQPTGGLEDCAAFIVVATYGKGEPTDNAVQLMQSLQDESFEFGHTLPSLKYVVFALGNRTCEHFNLIGRQVDTLLTGMGGTRISECGEGDDNKSMKEDYLEWKDRMWEAFAAVMGLESHPPEKVYLGEYSVHALTKTKGIHDAKNPFPSPISVARELFQITNDRNCVHMEFNIEGSGITYQHGDHVGLWPTNPDVEVDHLLCALGLYKKEAVVNVESLDPALAKVPFPVPTTYATVLRHYIDISALVGRQVLGVLSKYVPTPEAEAVLKKLNQDKEQYHNVVANDCLRLGEVLQLAAGNDVQAIPSPQNTTVWSIPFDIIISSIPRLQPQYYSISSSPKLHPQSIHVTAVVLKYESTPTPQISQRLMYGAGSNFLLNLKLSSNNEPVPRVDSPAYLLEGPRGAYKDGVIYKAPVHVRCSTFRLPTNPKSPVIMTSPGTGVAPFRGFIQERVAFARRTIEKNGPDALVDWGRIRLFYGCHRSIEDFLYKDEWPQYEEELQGKFALRCAFSRETFKPDGSKIYVQDLIWEEREQLAEAILNGKGYVYICGEAKNMSKQVEEILAKILGQAKGGSAKVEGAARARLLKERSKKPDALWKMGTQPAFYHFFPSSMPASRRNFKGTLGERTLAITNSFQLSWSGQKVYHTGEVKSLAPLHNNVESISIYRLEFDPSDGIIDRITDPLMPSLFH
ncbi:hypothetical protein JOM56_014670 [Amanita muscaria]